MRKNIFKTIIFVVAILAIIVGTMYLIDLDRMKNGEEVVFSTWGAKYAPVKKEQQNENNNVANVNYQKYSKTINNVKLELNIPNEWKYKEESIDNDAYEYALKLYKNNEEQYAMIYYFKNQFGVCGTGRTSKTIILNNGNEATIGYYDGNKNWSDISFYSINKNIAVMNYELIDNDAEEVIEFIKTINIEEKKSESLEIKEERRNPENVTIEVLKDTITNKKAEILITDNNEEQYGWGVEFRVEQKVNGEWKKLDYISDDLSWIEIAYLLDENNQLKMKVDFEKYYGTLENGTYRIVKPVYDNRYIDLYSNEFEIK